MKLKNIAFTLAETLVVMGIIGVIAALTIPNLSQSTGNKERVTKVQKAYANFVEAINRATAVYGPFTEWNSSGVDMNVRAGDRITEFMKLSKNCRNDDSCLTAWSTTAYHFQFADGTLINMQSYADSIYFDLIISKKSERIISGKNRFRGVFYFSSGELKYPYLQKDFSSLLSAVKYCVSSNPDESDGAGGAYCPDGSLVWIINYGNMDYLKLNATTGKCPNGNELTESNPRCN